MRILNVLTYLTIVNRDENDSLTGDCTMHLETDSSFHLDLCRWVQAMSMCLIRHLCSSWSHSCGGSPFNKRSETPHLLSIATADREQWANDESTCRAQQPWQACAWTPTPITASYLSRQLHRLSEAVRTLQDPKFVRTRWISALEFVEPH